MLSNRFRGLHSRRNCGCREGLGATRGCTGRRSSQKAEKSVRQVLEEGFGFVVEGQEVVLVLI